MPCSSHRLALSANACSNDRVTISLRFPVPSLARRCANLRRHLRGRRWRCKSQPCKRTIPDSGTPVRTNADRVRVYRPWCSSLRKGHNTNTRRLSAASADGARLPQRTVLMCSRLVLRLCAMAATRDATDPCASRLCLLSMARALPAERLLRQRLPHVRHTETAMRTLLGARTEVVELQTSQYCMRRVHCNIHARMHGMRQMLQLCYNIAWTWPQTCIEVCSPTNRDERVAQPPRPASASYLWLPIYSPSLVRLR